MSCLKLYTAPHECEPVILEFPAATETVPITVEESTAVLDRARLIHRNRLCQCCGRPAVVPMQSEDMLMSRNGLPIPGSGTLIGFQCDCCSHAWSIEEAQESLAMELLQ